LSGEIDRLAGEIAGLRTEMRALTQGLRLMLETQATHTEMLREILAAATLEPAPSPLAETLQQIFAELEATHAALAGLSEHIEKMPERIGEEIAAALADVARNTRIAD
jgi:ABC-type transporter Mla subunit MlaD